MGSGASTILAQAQELPAWKTVYTFVGTFPQSRMGLVLAGVGNTDADQVGDFLVGSIERLYTYSGARAGYPSLWTLHGDSHNDFSGAVAVPIADLDADGKLDVVVGAPFATLSGGQPQAGGLYVYSSRSDHTTPQGKQILSVRGPATGSRFGASVAVLGDINGDRVPDIVVGSPGATVGSQPEAGAVSVISGATGQTLLSVTNLVPGPVHLGSAVAGIGDVNGDSVPDFAVGAPDASFANRPNAGVVFTLSGRNGIPLDPGREGPEANMRLGAALTNAGDINGDNRPDLIVGAPGRTVAGQRGAGSAYVLTNLPFQSRIYLLSGQVAGDGFGSVVAGGGDVDGDGRPDFAVGAPLADVEGRQDAGLVQVYSGATGTLIYSQAGATGDQLGASIAFIGDVTGDGRADLAVGAPEFSFSQAIPTVGIAFIMSLPGL
jgi:hypothetical protein